MTPEDYQKVAEAHYFHSHNLEKKVIKKINNQQEYQEAMEVWWEHVRMLNILLKYGE